VSDIENKKAPSTFNLTRREENRNQRGPIIESKGEEEVAFPKSCRALIQTGTLEKVIRFLRGGGHQPDQRHREDRTSVILGNKGAFWEKKS